MRTLSRLSGLFVKLASTIAMLAPTAPFVAHAELPNPSHMTLGYFYHSRPGATPADYTAAVHHATSKSAGAFTNAGADRALQRLNEMIGLAGLLKARCAVKIVTLLVGRIS